MAKAVAVPYVIALILGIIVVAVIGYWFFVVAGGGGGQLSQTQCQANYINYCTQWSAVGYQPQEGLNGKVFTATYVGCEAYVSNFPTSQPDCQRALGQVLLCTPGTTQACTKTVNGASVAGTQDCGNNGLWGSCN